MKKHRFLVFYFFLFTIPLFSANKTVVDPERFFNVFSNIAENSIPSIVLVKAIKNNSETSLQANQQYFTTGSGFIISPDGHIITSGHVVKDSTKITIYYEEQEVPALLVNLNQDIDMAILKIDAMDLPYLHLGDSNKTRIGEWIVSFGYPFSTGPFLTLGVVSSKNSKLLVDGPLARFLFTDALINPGNSGGPILNIKNEVIGICTGVLASGDNEDEAKENQTGIGVAIPINAAKNDIQKFTNLKIK